ncbi:MAG: hypothetical protein WAT91_09605 [Saprospiraceae bacterium]
MHFRLPMFISLLLLMCFVSCRNDEVSEFTDSPIIESYIQPGDYARIKITRQIPFSSEVTYSSDDINNLNIEFVLNQDTYTFKPLGDGLYIDSSLVVSEGDNYVLSFQFNSKNVIAYTYVPQKPKNVKQSASTISIERISSGTFPSFGSMPDPVEISWDNADNSYYLIVVENIESTLDPIRDFGDNAPPSNFFRKQPTTSASEQIRPLEFQYYGTHRIIIYHVLPDYATLYDQNSTSSQNLTNPSTSIVNGYGIFTGLNSDTLWVEVKE